MQRPKCYLHRSTVGNSLSSMRTDRLSLASFLPPFHPVPAQSAPRPGSAVQRPSLQAHRHVSPGSRPSMSARSEERREGKGVSGRVDRGGRGRDKKKKKKKKKTKKIY